MRRKDREITKIDEILAIIAKCQVMRVAFVDGCKPYIVPLNFGIVKDEDENLSIYFHCAKEGKKLEIIKANNYVCFEVDCSLNIITNEKECEWTAEYESVIGSGTLTIVSDENEKEIGMTKIMEKYGFSGTARYNPQVFSRTKILKLTVKEVVGKGNLK